MLCSQTLLLLINNDYYMKFYFYVYRLSLKARVINIEPLRVYGSGKCFSLTLLDKTGEIRCTAFDEVVDLFYNKILVSISVV